jgi:D,D-heptose 1,7-bisphosphate phosphatase
MSKKYSALFFDRDGVLNKDTGYTHKIADLEFYEGVIDTLKAVSKTGYKIFIITNQPGIGIGLFSEEVYLAFESAFIEELKRLSDNNIRIDKVYHCPHHPEKGLGKYRTACSCRKPAPGMLLQADNEFGIDFASSYLIGDKRSDIMAGKTAGCKTVLVETGCAGKGGKGCEVEPDYAISNLSELLDILSLKDKK